VSAKPKLSKLKEPLAAYSKLYGVALSTVKRWRTRGLDLDNPEDVEAYRTQKTQGRKTGKEKAEQEGEEDFSFPKPKVDKKGKAEAGAAAALARLEEMEVAAYDQMAWAMKKGKPFAIKAARENWLKLGDSLRRYDTMIAEARRATGATLPRVEVERVLTVLAWFLRMGARQIAIAEAKDFAAEDRPGIIARKLEDLFGESMLNATIGLIATGEGKTEIPDWIGDALLSDLKELYKDVEAQCAARLDAFKKLAAATKRKEPKK